MTTYSQNSNKGIKITTKERKEVTNSKKVSKVTTHCVVCHHFVSQSIRWSFFFISNLSVS